MRWNETKTVEDVFGWATLPPNIPRMTYLEGDEIGYPSEVVTYLGLDELKNRLHRDHLLHMAALTRLCTLEDQIERGELKPVIRCKDCAHQRPSPFGVANLCWCIIVGHHRRPDYYCASADPKATKEVKADG